MLFRSFEQVARREGFYSPRLMEKVAAEFRFGRPVTRGEAEEMIMKVNGVATRFRDDFIHGEFTNPNPKLNEKAMDLCKRAIDACRELNGEVVTIWLGFDGFDYPFQVNYEKKWNDIVRHFQDIADYANDLKIRAGHGQARLATWTRAARTTLSPSR